MAATLNCCRGANPLALIPWSIDLYYYQHNIGDYRKDTSHLSLLEHGIYRQLLDTYYVSEEPLSSDHAKLMRSHSIRSADEQLALENVLKDFFVLTDAGYIQDRCDKEIAAYHGKSEKARVSAKARWSKGSSERNANALQTQSEGNAKHKPLTTNRKPSTNKKTSADKPLDSEYPAEFERVWAIYPSRPGANKKDACKAWNARLKAGATYEELFDGASRYASYVKATSTEPKYIKQAVTFFGPSEHYKTDWPIPQGKQSRHNGFDQIDYKEGVTEDGRIA